MDTLSKRLSKVSAAPTSKEEFDVWLGLEDAVEFLEANAADEDVVVYSTIPFVFTHAVLVPSSVVVTPDVEDLLRWNFGASSSWGVCYNFAEPQEIWIEPPLSSTGSKTIDGGEQLVFARFFDGRLGDKGYFEILQKFVHAMDLHFMAERNAYCKLSDLGDIVDVVRILTPSTGGPFAGTVITIRRRELHEFAALTDSVIVRMFDFTRYRPTYFSGWTASPEVKTVKDKEIFYKIAVEAGHAGYMRGCQILRTSVTKAQVAKSMSSPSEEEKQYVTLIAHDFKNGVVREISCAPGATVNYFTESDLPFEMSPAFFRPEVLLKYKADSDKYKVDGSSVSCRGAWHLETYGVNEAGQVHTYLVYLRRLPYEEQLYWKSFNESPKGPISKQSYKSDFMAEWDTEYEPLGSIKETLRKWSEDKTPWWTLRTDGHIERVQYPVTEGADEWASELMLLDQLLVEGLEEKWLRATAEKLKRTPDARLRTLKLVEECLMGLGFEEDHARKITKPFHELHELRSVLKGHASGESAVKIKKEAVAKYGSYKAHQTALCAECDVSLKTIGDAFSTIPE